MTRARECAGRRGEGRVSAETRRSCVCGPADCVIMQPQRWADGFFFFFLFSQSRSATTTATLLFE